MPNFISEDDIEQAILQKLEGAPFGYDVVRCDPSLEKMEALSDGTGRREKKECVLPGVLHEALFRLNPGIPGEKLTEIEKDLLRDFAGADLISVNYAYYQQIRNGIRVEFRRDGKPDFDFVKLVDFERPENNTFTAVSQMWIKGRYYWHRPDVLVFVNGLPMIFMELKNSIVKVEEAYRKNLTEYKKDIPNLFAFNQVCVLSNGLETRLGAFNAGYNHFCEHRGRKLGAVLRGRLSEQGAPHRLYREFHHVPESAGQNHRQEPPVLRRQQPDGVRAKPRGASGQAGRVLAHPGLRQGPTRSASPRTGGSCGSFCRPTSPSSSP